MVVKRELNEPLPRNGEIGNGRSSFDNVKPTRGGNSEAYTLRRLRRDRPDLADRVINRELSSNAAAIEAGFREKSITIPFNPEGAARALIRKFTIDDLHQIVEYLTERIAVE